MSEEQEKDLQKRTRPHDRSWYAVPCGLLLRRLMEVEATADFDNPPRETVDAAVHDWVRSVAFELACQVDEPTDEFTIMVMDGTDDLLARRSHGGAPEGNQNARGNRGGGAPRGNKNARRRRGDDD